MLSTVTAYKASISYSGSDRDTAYTALLTAVSAAVETMILPNVLGGTTVTRVIAAPPYPVLVLSPRPVQIATLQLWRNTSSNGDPAAFTTADLLALYTDYHFCDDNLDPTGTYSLDGRIRSLRGVWGVGYEWTPGNLAYATTPRYASLKVSYTAGYAAIPGGVVEAVHLAVSMLFARRKLGMPVTSESLNGYQYSLATPFLMAALNSPDVRQFLDPYMPSRIV